MVKRLLCFRSGSFGLPVDGSRRLTATLDRAVGAWTTGRLDALFAVVPLTGRQNQVHVMVREVGPSAVRESCTACSLRGPQSRAPVRALRDEAARSSGSRCGCPRQVADMVDARPAMELPAAPFPPDG